MKTNEFENFVIRLFKIEYKQQMTNKSSDLWNEFDNKCFEKAKELGMNVDELESDGECLGFISDSHYKTEQKSFWWNYQGQKIVFYSWV
jgi:hypothetical protein